MDVKRFENSPIGKVVPITIAMRDQTVDHFAYVPQPLPARIELSDATRMAVSEADQALGKLEGLASLLPNPHLLIRPTIRREAVSTSALEGTHTALTDLLEAEFVESSRDRAEVVEVLNYMRATEAALLRLQREPIHLNMLLGLHSILFQRVRADMAEIGQVRSVPVLIGPSGARPAAAHFVPPPPAVLHDLLDDWEKWNYRDDHIPIVVRAAVSHYQFETIHPFRDGNGRIGRLVAALLLIDRGPLSGHLFSLSPFLEARRAEYGELLRNVSATGEWNDWVEFFARGVANQADGSRLRVERLIHWREETVARLRAEGLKGTTITIAESLIGYPGVTPTEAAVRFDVTYRSANRSIGKLEALGILTETTGRTYDRFFLCRDVVDIIQSHDPD